MNTRNTPRLLAAACLALPALATTLLVGQNDDDEQIFELSPFTVSSGMGVTAGGAQDIGYSRQQIALGNIPHPNTIRAEGLLSEHDLPLNAQASCDAPICVFGEAMPASILQLPDAAYLAQIGFASGIDAASWRRAPLNLVAVIDKSGSMSRDLDFVRQSLLFVLDQLDERDQLSIVLYGDRSHVHLAPTAATPANRVSIESHIASIRSSGSTNMEEGLKVGYQVADASAPSFAGATRLMLFTDEQPNTGNTSKHGFMGQMREGSRKGYGLTTIGVGAHFGAELANALSAVRGGNLFFFPDTDVMADKFETEFPTMVTEMAHDMELTIQPARGFRISGVYGVPGDMLRWKDDRSIALKVETLFLSLRKGAIYFTLERDLPSNLPRRRVGLDTSIASVSLSYLPAGQAERVHQNFNYTANPRAEASLGLARGELLLSEYVSLKKATAAHYIDNDQKAAYAILAELAQLFHSSEDPTLDRELETILQLANKFAFLSGYDSHAADLPSSPLAAHLWIAYPEENAELDDQLFVRFHPTGLVEFSQLGEDGNFETAAVALLKDPLPVRKRGVASFLAPDNSALFLAALANLPAQPDSANFVDLSYGLVFTIKGDRLTLEPQGEIDASDFPVRTLRRYAGAAPKNLLTRLAPPKIDPVSGLPTKNFR